MKIFYLDLIGNYIGYAYQNFIPRKLDTVYIDNAKYIVAEVVYGYTDKRLCHRDMLTLDGVALRLDLIVKSDNLKSPIILNVPQNDRCEGYNTNC